MTGIRSKNKRQGHTVVPNWRWEDQTLNPFELRVAGWLASHADNWREAYVSRNMIAERTGIAASTVSKAIAHLVAVGMVVLSRDEPGKRWVIEFDFAVWETPSDISTIPTGSPLVATRPVVTRPVTGRHTTSNRSSHDHIEEQREQQRENPQTPAKSGGRKARRSQPPEPLTPLERVDDFDEWWKSWPRKLAKLDAVTAWRVMLGHLPNVDVLVGASADIAERTRREHQGDDQWQRYIPHPSTWLRRGDYLDFDVETAAPREARHPCVLCGVPDPCVERCQGVETGAIEDIGTECVWRTT